MTALAVRDVRRYDRSPVPVRPNGRTPLVLCRMQHAV